MKDKKFIGFWVSKDLYRKILRTAKTDGRSVSNYMRFKVLESVEQSAGGGRASK